MTQITLKTPIKHGDKSIDTIEVSEPSVGAVAAFTRAAAGGEDAAAVLDGTLALLAFDTGIPVEALQRVKISDLNAISGALAPFMEQLTPASGGTGASSPQT
jgi:hypothetical protein